MAPVCVIVPAFDAAKTISATVRSVLSEPEVGEVIVVDDASRDATSAVAATADDGSGRFRILQNNSNLGPSASRNRAIAETRLPFLAVVDADDRIISGRFRHLLGLRHGNWDFVADNIAFVRANDGQPGPVDLRPATQQTGVRRLGLEHFVLGNIPEPANPRNELGFLKPLFRREFLLQHTLHYDERLRLGEDFILYAQALIAGAHFLVSENCGYVALERRGSLSGLHRTADLQALLAASAQVREQARCSGVTGGTLSILDRHAAALAGKVAVRLLLDDAQTMGRARALASRIGTPIELLQSLVSLRQDRARGQRGGRLGTRLLLDECFFV